uniref:Apple domain-containing protein n=1 Tax=Parascaris univalens TaxID=6257 RepID=A0A915BX33_PARUN
MQRLLKWPNELPRPANDNPDRPKMSDGWRCYASAVQLEAGRGWRCYHRPSYRNKQQQQQPITLPPTLPPFPQPPRQPIRPRPQPPHSPPRIHVPTQTSPVMAQNLRTGVCHASIFYISSPMQSPSRLTFTHFAITISVDQCARTCHEFNCAIAHYDPSNGHCQFNPSTAFSVREGQCPRWPAVHYRNNIITREAIRIFCVQCHRPFRRGRGRFRGGRFRTRIVQTQFTGRVPASLRSAVVARSAKHSFEPIILGDSVAGHVKGHLVRQPQAANVDAEPLEANSEKKQSDNSGDRDAVDITELGHQMEATSGGLSLKQQEALPSSKITKENSSEAQIAFE